MNELEHSFNSNVWLNLLISKKIGEWLKHTELRQVNLSHIIFKNLDVKFRTLLFLKSQIINFA